MSHRARNFSSCDAGVVSSSSIPSVEFMSRKAREATLVHRHISMNMNNVAKIHTSILLEELWTKMAAA